MGILTFHPRQNGASATLLIAVSSAVGVAFQPSTGSDQGLMLANMSTNPLYFTCGLTSAVAVSLPSSSAVGGLPILAGTKETFGVAPNCWLSAMTSSGSAVLASSPGYGQ